MHSSKVLVIEYEHDTRVAYREALEPHGYTIISAANGLSGLEILQKDAKTIQLVILCLRMPILDGNDFLKLKSADDQIKTIPVIVVAREPKDLRHPATEVLQKPVASSDLLNAVRKISQTQ